MEDARLDAELPAAFADGDPSVARTAQGAMLTPASVPIGHVARQLWSMVEITDGNESGSLR